MEPRDGITALLAVRIAFKAGARSEALAATAVLMYCCDALF